MFIHFFTMLSFFKHWKEDLPSSLVVFLVALPLCLGVALASTGPDNPVLFSGIIAGVVGGVVVGFLSGSRLGVSGPAAGLITIVVASITTLGSFEAFLVAVVLAGIIQFIAGILGAGILGNYFPSSVIKGMLAAIGLTLILKEIPHAIGYDADFIGDESFFQTDGENTFSELFKSLDFINFGAIIVSLISIGVLILFDRPFLKRIALFKFIPGALIVVVLGIVLNLVFTQFFPNLAITEKHLVVLPVAKTLSDVGSFFTFPDFSVLMKNTDVYVIALTIALVASLESLLSLEAIDKLDPKKPHTSTNRELRAQGIGNILSGLIGGLPVTQVIVRSSANISSGGQSKFSTIFHGLLLFVAVLFIPTVLNQIPLASLAAILIMVGYKLSKVNLYKHMYSLGLEQFLPFITTIIAILLTDLLKGIGIGIAISIFFILRKNYRNNYVQEKTIVDGKTHFQVQLSEEVTFLNKGSVLDLLENIPRNSRITIDGSNCKAIDYDVLELIQEFVTHGSKERNIDVETINIPEVIVSGGH